MIDTATNETNSLLGEPMVFTTKAGTETLSAVKADDATETAAALMVKREKLRSVAVLLGVVAFWLFVIDITQIDVKATWALMLLVFAGSAFVSNFMKPAPEGAGFWRRNSGLTALYLSTIIAGVVMSIPPHGG